MYLTKIMLFWHNFRCGVLTLLWEWCFSSRLKPYDLRPSIFQLVLVPSKVICGYQNSLGSTGVVVRPEVSSLRVVGSTPTQWTGLSICNGRTSDPPSSTSWSIRLVLWNFNLQIYVSGDLRISSMPVIRWKINLQFIRWESWVFFLRPPQAKTGDSWISSLCL